MHTYLTFLLLLILLLSTSPSTTLSTCPSSTCSKSAPAVRFPFPLLTSNKNPDTIYQGYNISCNQQSLTILTLPNSHDHFNVRNIDYYHQQITLYDPNNCMPKRYMNLNLSNSPFYIKTSHYINFTILTCPTNIVQSRYTTIECLSNSTTSILATSSISLANSISNSCSVVDNVGVPIYDQNYYVNDDDDKDVFSYDVLKQDVRLSWNISRCVSCEGNDGFCGLGNDQELGCYVNCQLGAGPSPSEIRLFRLVILCFTIPAVAFTVGIALYFWFLDHSRTQPDQSTPDPNTQIHPFNSTITSSPPTNGLDELTIESYTKVVVGESKRIPGPNDIACPICLIDYCTNDMLRCIPECRHCFHVECVDEWLRGNSTCPICRNSPSRDVF